MALQTVDVLVSADDGWVEVASNPASLIIKPDGVHPWWIAVTSGAAPAAGLEGLPMGRGGEGLRESFQSGVITGKVFVRIRTPPASVPGSKLRFGVIKDV
jgi:hypothetical protein